MSSCISRAASAVASFCGSFWSFCFSPSTLYGSTCCWALEISGSSFWTSVLISGKDGELESDNTGEDVSCLLVEGECTITGSDCCDNASSADLLFSFARMENSLTSKWPSSVSWKVFVRGMLVIHVIQINSIHKQKLHDVYPFGEDDPEDMFNVFVQSFWLTYLISTDEKRRRGKKPAFHS